MALEQEMKNNAKRIRTPKILRKPEIETGDRATLKSLERKWTCHKIHHKWEGRSAAFQSGYRGAFPLFFSEWREKTVTGQGVIPKCKTHLRDSINGGIYIGRPILTHSTSPPRAKIFPCRNCVRDWVLEKFFTQEFDQNSPLLKKFHLGIGGKIFL